MAKTARDDRTTTIVVPLCHRNIMVCPSPPPPPSPPRLLIRLYVAAGNKPSCRTLV